MTTSTSAQAVPASKKKDHQLPSDNKTRMSGGAKFVVYAILVFFTIVFLGPILFIFINSFKSSSLSPPILSRFPSVKPGSASRTSWWA